ncbi:MAG: hypothetical protein J6S10_03915, partial [Clostridia bacterium]|nr:hypothetical protein [Clostridia bacterium]
MQYDRYELKIQKIEKFLKLIFRHLGKIITSAALVASLAVTLLATRGIITTSAESQPLEIVYGEELNYEAKAFLSDVEYEYSLRGSDNWSKDFPKEPGYYQVRAVAKATVGYRYSEIQEFIIKKKPVNVVISSENVAYGEDPEVSADLVSKDRISDISFDYTYSDNGVWVDIESVEISDENGNIVTSRYEITTEGRGINTIAREITICIENASKVYDGTALSSNKYTISNGTLAKDDRIDITFSTSITQVGRERKSYRLRGAPWP